MLPVKSRNNSVMATKKMTANVILAFININLSCFVLFHNDKDNRIFYTKQDKATFFYKEEKEKSNLQCSRQVL